MALMERAYDKVEDVREWLMVARSNADCDPKEVGDAMEEFYEIYQELRRRKEVTREVVQQIDSHLRTMQQIWRQVATTEEQTGQVDNTELQRLEEPACRIQKVLESQINGEPCPTIDVPGLGDFNFPQDLFTTTPIKFAPLEQLDDTLQYSSYLDGILSISKEGDIGFLKNVYKNYTWKKDSQAKWLTKDRLKGLNVQMFPNGLPAFYINEISMLGVWAIFMPDSPVTENTQLYTLTYFKNLYNTVVDIALPAAIRAMPTTSAMRVVNSSLQDPKPERYYLVGHELSIFSNALKQQIHNLRQSRELPSWITFHFLADTFGQDTPLTESTIQATVNAVDIDKTVETIVHLATNIKKDNKCLFWDKTFIEKAFHSTGSTYFTCGFYQLANGDGTKTRAIGKAIAPAIVSWKCYNTLFKRIRTQRHQYLHFSEDQVLFQEPVLAKLLAGQPSSIANVSKRSHPLHKVYMDASTKTSLQILQERVDNMQALPSLHLARVEFLCSLKIASFQFLLDNYTGNIVKNQLVKICNVMSLQTSPIVELPSDEICTYVRKLISSLSFPIQNTLQSFFVERRPMTPDAIETVHMCEIFISFILYGSKNFLQPLARIGLTMNHFKSLNRITLAYTDMRRQGTSFMLDASKNTSGTVFTIRPRIVPRDTPTEEFTNQLLQIHTNVMKLDKYSVGLVFLGHVLTGLIELGARDPRLTVYFSNRDPFTIFSKIFVSSAPRITQTKTCCTVSEFIRDLLRAQIGLQLSAKQETACETLGDLLSSCSSDDINNLGKTQLHEALVTIFHSALKGTLNFSVDFVPRFQPDITMNNYVTIIPDFTTLLLQKQPPVFQDKLSRICIERAVRLVGFPYDADYNRADNHACNMYLLYKLLIADISDTTRLITLLGISVGMRTVPRDHAFHNRLRTFRVTLLDLLSLGLCTRDNYGVFESISNTHFRFQTVNSVSPDEKDLMVSHRNLAAYGFRNL